MSSSVVEISNTDCNNFVCYEGFIKKRKQYCPKVKELLFWNDKQESVR